MYCSNASLTIHVLSQPLSFLLWYRPAYNAYMKELSVFYYMYFLFAGFHLAFSAYMVSRAVVSPFSTLTLLPFSDCWNPFVGLSRPHQPHQSIRVR